MKTTPKNISQDFTPKEFAHKINRHPNTVYKWLKLGILPAYKLGGRWQILQDARAIMKKRGLTYGIRL